MILLALLLFAAPPPEDVEFYQRGLALFNERNYADALPNFEHAIKVAPKNAQYWKAYAVALAAMEDYRGSIEPFRKACELDPRLLDACYYYGRALYAADRYQDALPPLALAMKTDAVRARAETAMAQCHEALGHADEAEKLFRSALQRKDSFQQQARLAYGRFLVRQGRAAAGVFILQAAQEPESSAAHYELGLALTQDGRDAEALPHLERAFALDQNNEAAYLLMEKTKLRMRAETKK